MAQPSSPRTELFSVADHDYFRVDDGRADDQANVVRPYQPAYHPQVIFRAADGDLDEPPTSFEPAHRRRTPRWLIGLGAILAVMVLGCVGALALLGFGAKSVSETITRNADSAKRDITISTCHVDPATGFMSAAVAIRNHGTARASYLIDVSFNSADGKRQLDSTVVAADNLAAGATTHVQATTLSAATGTFTCAVASVTKI